MKQKEKWAEEYAYRPHSWNGKEDVPKLEYLAWVAGFECFRGYLLTGEIKTLANGEVQFVDMNFIKQLGELDD